MNIDSKIYRQIRLIKTTILTSTTKTLFSNEILNNDIYLTLLDSLLRLRETQKRR